MCSAIIMLFAKHILNLNRNTTRKHSYVQQQKMIVFFFRGALRSSLHQLPQPDCRLKMIAFAVLEWPM